ncbi:MAG TPA: hypothetical protein VJS67_07495 [Pseudonocardiaceae bacterium]|nr:hypothetical protein [Pseudonocardiaceae bacterium]
MAWSDIAVIAAAKKEIVATTASRGGQIKRMVIMTMATAGLIIGAGTAAVNSDFRAQVIISKGPLDPSALRQTPGPNQDFAAYK